MTEKMTATTRANVATSTGADLSRFVGVVGDVPPAFTPFRAVLARINGNTDMAADAMRADVAVVVAAMIAARGDGAAAKNRGRWTGFRTYDFQNTLFAVNDRADWRFTDRTLAVAWAAELSANRCDFIAHADYVGSTRTAYTHGRHGTNVIDPWHTASRPWTVDERRAAAPKRARAAKPAAEPVDVPTTEPVDA